MDGCDRDTAALVAAWLTRRLTFYVISGKQETADQYASSFGRPLVAS